MKKYNDDDVNYCVMFRLRQYLVKLGKLCNEIDLGSIKRKQLDLCKGNIIVCHVDCFCLQERKKKEDEAKSIFLFTRLTRPPQQTTWVGLRCPESKN